VDRRHVERRATMALKFSVVRAEANADHGGAGSLPSLRRLADERRAESSPVRARRPSIEKSRAGGSGLRASRLARYRKVNLPAALRAMQTRSGVKVRKAANMGGRLCSCQHASPRFFGA
jgi:hypothetical protein